MSKIEPSKSTLHSCSAKYPTAGPQGSGSGLGHTDSVQLNLSSSKPSNLARLYHVSSNRKQRALSIRSNPAPSSVIGWNSKELHPAKTVPCLRMKRRTLQKVSSIATSSY